MGFTKPGRAGPSGDIANRLPDLIQLSLAAGSQADQKTRNYDDKTSKVTKTGC